MRCSQKGNSGFSLIEMMAVVAVLGVLLSMAVIGITSALPQMRANTATNEVLGLIRQARHTAISDRRTVQIAFNGNNQIQLLEFPPVDGGVAVPLSAPIPLEGGAQFISFGLPDTPMGFGTCGNGLCFTNPINANGGLPTTQFLSDGTFSAAINNPVNGTIFLGIPGKPETARAITMLGATGRMHVYRWSGQKWQE